MDIAIESEKKQRYEIYELNEKLDRARETPEQHDERIRRLSWIEIKRIVESNGSDMNNPIIDDCAGELRTNDSASLYEDVKSGNKFEKVYSLSDHEGRRVILYAFLDQESYGFIVWMNEEL